jgi:glycolate oxidase
MAFVSLPDPDQATILRRQIIVDDIARLIGREQLISDEDGRRAFETDALTAYRRMPLVVVLPRSTDEVAKVLRYCHDNALKVVPRGAGTSLCGGALPAEDAVVLCVSKMNRILDVDYPNRVARVEAGITNLAISARVSGDGFFYAPDPSSQLACTLAGNLAMNSGGAHCLKYGVTTNNILGVKMVLMDGTVIELGGAHLDAPGYDFLSYIIGSEGQLGVITEATVRILRAAEGARPMLIAFNSPEDAGACVSGIIGAGIVPVAIEYMDKPAIEVCEAFASAGYPLDCEALLIVEVEGSEAEIGTLLGRIAEIATKFAPRTIVISSDADQSARIWAGRKAAFGAVGRISDYYCMDGTIPLGQLPKVLTRIGSICAGYGLKVANIFHAGDGNLHPLILYNANNPDEAIKAEQAGADILKLCVEVGGCLTGEHGVGIEKRDLMTVQFSPTDLAVQMRIKSVFDPGWLLNPAKVFPLEASAAFAAQSDGAMRGVSGTGASSVKSPRAA